MHSLLISIMLNMHVIQYYGTETAQKKCLYCGYISTKVGLCSLNR